MDNNTNQNVNQNVNQTATPEIKTEEVATNKKEKKPKEKKVKEQKPAMDKEDEKWYALALLFLIISLVPYLSRIMDPNYDEFKYADKDKDKDKDKDIYIFFYQATLLSRPEGGKGRLCGFAGGKNNFPCLDHL